MDKFIFEITRKEQGPVTQLNFPLTAGNTEMIAKLKEEVARIIMQSEEIKIKAASPEQKVNIYLSRFSGTVANGKMSLGDYVNSRVTTIVESVYRSHQMRKEERK